MNVVLLAEDDPAIAEPLSRALHREGYAVQIVGDGPAALEAANAGGADLLVLDLGCPGWTASRCAVGCGRRAVGCRC